MSEHHSDSERSLDELRLSIEDELQGADTALDHVLCAARLAAIGEPDAYLAWPGALGDRAADLSDELSTACLDLVVRLRRAEGEELVRALLEAQAFHTLRIVDRDMGGLLEPAHSVIESMLLECDGLPLDDEAAGALHGLLELELTPDAFLLPILVAPVGLTACLAISEARIAAGLRPVEHIGRAAHFDPAEQLEPELTFDGGRPSARMIERFARRRGEMRFDDGTTAEVRAVLEEDWQVTVKFRIADADEAWCRRIDLVRIGARLARPIDDLRDFWTTSLANLGVDAQTRLMNQPILIKMSNGQRFSI